MLAAAIWYAFELIATQLQLALMENIMTIITDSTQCTLELEIQSGGTKYQLFLDCPSCQFNEISLDPTQTCKFHEDLEFDNGRHHNR